MATLASEPNELADIIESLEEGDEILINERTSEMEVTSVESSKYEPMDLRFVQLQGPRGGLYAIRLQRSSKRIPDVGLMRYHKTKGRWVNASEGLLSIEHAQ